MKLLKLTNMAPAVLIFDGVNDLGDWEGWEGCDWFEAVVALPDVKNVNVSVTRHRDGRVRCDAYFNSNDGLAIEHSSDQGRALRDLIQPYLPEQAIAPIPRNLGNIFVFGPSPKALQVLRARFIGSNGCSPDTKAYYQYVLRDLMQKGVKTVDD